MTTSALPVGSIVAILASATSPPDGWLFCDGSTFDGETYPKLAKILTDNTLPDLRGYTLIGAGPAYTPRSAYGQLQHTLTLSEMPSHQHLAFGEHQDGWPFGNSLGEGNLGSKGGTDWDNYYFGTSWTGGNGSAGGQIATNNGAVTYGQPSPNDAFQLLQPSYAVNYFIYAG